MPGLAPTTTVTVALPSLAATAALAGWAAGQAQARDVIALWGGLGVGKTAFARAFIQARPGGEGISEVPSPTFTLVQIYDLAPPVWHFDLYRLTRADEAWELGLEDAFADAISLIEWPERLDTLLPAERLDVTLSLAAQPSARAVELTGHGGWARKLDTLSLEALRV